MKNEINMLYIEFTKKCNSRCITCSYWKNQTEERNVHGKDITKLISKLTDLQVVLFTGGEAVIYAEELFLISRQIKTMFPHIELRLLTNGINLAKYMDTISSIFQVVVFSFDAANETTYQRIRGINAFNKVVESVKILRDKGIKIRFRSMILDQNYEELFEIVQLAYSLQVNQITFLPVDDSSSIGFGRNKEPDFRNGMYNKEKIIETLEKIFGETEWRKSGVLPSDGKNIKEMILYYKGELTHSVCNAPDTSIVLEMNGDIKGCFFRPAIGNICLNEVENIIDSSLFICEKQTGLRRCFLECKSCIL